MVKFATKEDIVKALSNTRNQRDWLFVQVLANTGVRISEAINICEQDLIYPENQIIVRGKGNNIRNIDVPSTLMTFLKNYVSHVKLKRNDRLFPFTRENGYLKTKKLCGINPHAFRHGYAIRLLRTTRNIRYVQKQLGHNSMKTTEIYLEFMEFAEDKKKLDRIFY